MLIIQRPSPLSLRIFFRPKAAESMGLSFVSRPSAESNIRQPRRKKLPEPSRKADYFIIPAPRRRLLLRYLQLKK